MIGFLRKIHFWDIAALKNTLFWVFGTALIILFNSHETTKETHYFKKIIMANIKLIIVIEFIVNMYSFSFVTELILVPVVTFIVLIKTVAEFNLEHKHIEKIFNFILIIIGTILIILSIDKVITNFNDFATLQNLQNFLLPPTFTVLFLPFIYFFVLYMKYESVFISINIYNQNVEFRKYLKGKIIKTCHVNMAMLNKISKDFSFLKINSREELSVAIEKFKKKYNQ